MNTFNTFRALDERTMTTKEKAKEDRLKDKYDDSSMKKNMKDHYGKEEGEKVYYATIRKQAMKKEEMEVDEAVIAPALAVAGGIAGGVLAGAGKLVGGAISGAGSIAKGSIKAVKKVKKGIEEPVEEGLVDIVKKGAKRHSKAVEKKKIKNRKAVPYAALAAEHKPEGELVDETYFDTNRRGISTKGGFVKQYNKPGKLSRASLNHERKSKDPELRMSKKELRKSMEDDANYEKKMGRSKPTPSNLKTALKKMKEDYYSGTGEKVQKRTLAWMRKKGMKGAPGLNAMKEREAEHKAKRGVKGVKEEVGCETKKVENKGKKKIDPNKNPVVEAKVDQGRSDYGKASIRNYRRKGPGHGEPAMFDPENKRGKLIDKRREEHKARRGVKGAKVPAYKVEHHQKDNDGNTIPHKFDWRNDLSEEGYDRWRDDRLVKYGIGHDGSDKKGSIKRAPETKVKGKTVLQKETEKKYGKGVSALDVVKAKIKAKHGKDAIMEPKK